MTRDPLTYIDAFALYQFIRSNPINLTDPSGTQSNDTGSASVDESLNPIDQLLADLLAAIDALTVAAAAAECKAWAAKEQAIGTDWLKNLRPCPCTAADAEASLIWEQESLQISRIFHKCADKCFRSVNPGTGVGPGQQCCFSKSGKLLTGGPGAGTPDRIGPGGFGLAGHVLVDVRPYLACAKAGMLTTYFKYRPPNPGVQNNGAPCPGVVIIDDLPETQK